MFNSELIIKEERFEYEQLEGDEDFEKSPQTGETLTITPVPEIRAKNPIPGNEPPFICEICGHKSTTKNILASHRHRKHRPKNRMLQCTKCEKNFDSKKKLERHLQRPSCEPYPIYTCEYCSKKLLGLANYNIHLRFHQKLYPFVCKECGKGFMLTVHLKTHITTKHENKRYVCEHPTCGRLFQSQNSLKVHMYVHLDSLPYRCEYCAKMFPNKGKLKSHIKKAHDIIHSLDELHHMQVAEEIVLRTEPKTVNLKTVFQ